MTGTPRRAADRQERLRRLFGTVARMPIAAVDPVDHAPPEPARPHPVCPGCGIRLSLVDQISEDGW